MVWMRTELLTGYTLQELLARQGRLSLPFALGVAIEAAFGLHAVHEAQIIHRDVKPSNLFYTRGRGVKVLDLSLAKVFPEGLETTVGGRRLGLGTPAYSAPEQLEGLVRPDVRFDVYGLGVTLWEMLTGQNPFAAVLDDMTELIKRQLTVMPPLLAEVANLPPRVDTVVRRALAKDPAQRYGSVMEMARALMELSAWAAAEARGRRLVIVVPPGEPSLPGDANTWRDYRPPEQTPAHEAPESAPQARVIVANATPMERPVRPARLAGTLPMEPRSVLAGTLPLDQASLSMGAVRSERGTDLLPPDPGRPLGSVPARAAESPRATEAPSRAPAATPSRGTPAPPAAPPRHETPTALTPPTLAGPTFAGPRPAARTPWPAVLVAVVASSLLSVALIVWLLGRGPAVADTAPIQALPAAPTTSQAALIVTTEASSPPPVPPVAASLPVSSATTARSAASTSPSSRVPTSSRTQPGTRLDPMAPWVPTLPPPPPTNRNRPFGLEQ